jgi:hypothetical protein
LGQRKEIDRTPLHAFVATPAYDGKVYSDFSQSLAEAAFCSPLYGVKLTASVMGNGAFIDLARNIYVKMFLEDFPDCTHLFFIDADLKFEARAFLGLLKSGHPICAGAYRRRQEPEEYPVQWWEAEGGGIWVEDDWLQCRRVATGFLCIERSVIEEMAKDAVQMEIHGQKGLVPQLFYTKLTPENKFMGEDYAFCDDYVKRYGKPIQVWTDFDFTHAGYKCNYHKYLLQKIEEQEKSSLSSAA